MPTKRRRIPRLARPDLSPAAIFLLMTGTYAQSYLPGWANLDWDLAPFDHDEEAWRDEVWPAVAEALTADAAAAGFRPWAASGRRPRTPAAQAWMTTFLAQHGRRG